MRKIDASGIGIKTPIRVYETTRNVKKTFKFQQQMVDVLNVDGKDRFKRAMAYFGNQITGIDEEIDYLTDVLRLTDKQVKHLDNVDFSKVQDLARTTADKILHRDDDEASGQTKGKKSSPKK